MVRPRGPVTRIELTVADPPRVAAFLAAVLGRPPGSGTPPLVLRAATRSSGVVLSFGVPDLPAAVAGVQARGGRAVGLAPRRWACVDDQGTRFDLSDEPTAPADGAAVAYFTLGVADLDRAAAFYGALLGWDFHAVHDGAGLAVGGVDAAGGPGGALWASPVPGSVVTFAVPDVAAAGREVVARGGTVTRLEQRPYGVALDNCTDGRAIRFHLLQFAAGRDLT